HQFWYRSAFCQYGRRGRCWARYADGQVLGAWMERDEFELVNAQLVAAIAAVDGHTPRILTTNEATSLPAGPLQRGHRSMQVGLQRGCEPGFIEQLYTFADRDRGEGPALEVSYLGLTAITGEVSRWRSWYDFFPWEDRRESHDLICRVIAPRLRTWSSAGGPH